MTRIIITGTVLFCLFFLNGCATIMSHGPQALSILSQPEGAACEITDTTEGKRIVKAETPYIATLERGAGYFLKKYYDVTLSKDGYMTEKVTLTPQLNFWYVCNLIFGGAIGALIVDPLTGNMWTFYQKDVNIKLYPDTLEGRTTRTADELAKAEAKVRDEEAQRAKQTAPY